MNELTKAEIEDAAETISNNVFQQALERAWRPKEFECISRQMDMCLCWNQKDLGSAFDESERNLSKEIKLKFKELDEMDIESTGEWRAPIDDLVNNKLEQKFNDEYKRLKKRLYSSC